MIHNMNQSESCLRQAIAVRLRGKLSVQGQVFHSFFQDKLLLERNQ
jgi:hypothetical protein